MDDLAKLAGALSAGERSAVVELATWVESEEGRPIPRTRIDEMCGRYECDVSRLLTNLKLSGILADVPRKRHRFPSKGPTLMYFELPDLPNTPQNNRIAAECWELYQPSGMLMQLRELCEGHTGGTDSRTSHSSDFASVNWDGTFYQFTTNQAACVRVLWEAWENRTPVISEATVQDAAGVNSALRIVFRNHPAWNTLIVSPSKGRYRLAEPTI